MTQSELRAFGNPSRRRFMQGSALIAGATALPAAGLSAEPMRGGTLRYGCAHGATTDSLDPGTFENDFSIGLSHLTHNFIFEIGTDSGLLPEVAASWDVLEGGKVWSIELRQGIEFHNGKTLAVEDVIASLNHHRGDEATSAMKTQISTIVDMQADGPNRVILTLDAPNVDYGYVLADYHIPIMPSKDGMAEIDSGIGCGPYVLDDFDPGVRYTGSRNPNYHKSDRAHFDAIEMLSIVDPAARTNALTSGDIDAMGRVDLKTVHLLERNNSIDIKSVAGFQHYTFPMRTDTPPFDNNHVRLALKFVIDRQEIVEKILRGYGTVGNDHPISPAVAFFNAELPIREYDPEQAKWHLQQAGMTSIKVQLSAADAAFVGAVDASVLIAESAKAAGIDIEVIREPNDGYWDNVWLQKPWCACYWGGRVTPDAMFSVAYAAGSNWNDTYWEHDRFNELLVQGRAETDNALRAEIYGEMQQIVRDEGGVVVPMFTNHVYATSKNVMHGELAPNWDMDGQRFGERWWFG